MPSFTLTRRRLPLTWHAGIARPELHARSWIRTSFRGGGSALREASADARAPESGAPIPGTRRLVSKEQGSLARRGGAAGGQRMLCDGGRGAEPREERPGWRAAHARALGVVLGKPIGNLLLS